MLNIRCNRINIAPDYLKFVSFICIFAMLSSIFCYTKLLLELELKHKNNKGREFFTTALVSFNFLVLVLELLLQDTNDRTSHRREDCT